MRKRVGYLLFACTFNAFCSSDISLTLVGYIPSKCEFTAFNNSLILSSKGHASTELVIDCNSPMRVSMQSVNGGLSHQQSTQINSYNVTWSIEKTGNSETYSSRTLKTTQYIDVTDVLFKSMAKLQLELVEPLIYAGDYQDVIRIEMTPSAISGGVW
ncbi:hypothetical protein [Marinomonas sp.]|uniref:hypothetical protein n=1 Tax=Marinomonas sp. TaxID=1904862 RepID=UPI003BA87D63